MGSVLHYGHALVHVTCCLVLHELIAVVRLEELLMRTMLVLQSKTRGVGFLFLHT